MPVIAARKVVRTNAPTIAQESHEIVSEKVSAYTTCINQVKENKTSVCFFSKYSISKNQNEIAQNNDRIMLSYSPYITGDGIPGHDAVTDNTRRDKFDGVASAGLILAVLSFLFLFAYGLGLLFVLPALICSIIGLKSQHRHTQAVIGLIMSIVVILVAALIIATLVAFL